MKRVVVVGAGINGLVAANYLARAGYEVTVLERKSVVGGACCSAVIERDGIAYEYPQGASVLGLMQDFIFEETGLSEHVQLHAPVHPQMLYGPGEGNIFNLPEHEQFTADEEKAVTFLRKGYREAVVPTLSSAEAALGAEIAQRWIRGSAKELLSAYEFSEAERLFYAVSVIESGPVSLDEPYSAFTIPLMSSGSVFGGDWGYVKGGIWQIPKALQRVNDTLGVRAILDAKVKRISPEESLVVEYEHDSRMNQIEADHVILATDPHSAVPLLADEQLSKSIASKRSLGTSGKLVLFFREPVRWKGDASQEGFDAALRHILVSPTLEAMELSSERVASGALEFDPSYLEVYPEGAGSRELGEERPYDLVSVFFKNISFGKRGVEMEEAKRRLEEIVLSYVENPQDLVFSLIETPKDIADLFFYAKGNIDHLELAEGQTFFQRTFSPDPKNNFYQFGSDERVLYCGAGSYPCGSIAGTPGYMCAAQLLRHVS